MLHVGISYSFEKKKRLLIVDYIKPSPVYQVKCKLVHICNRGQHSKEAVCSASKGAACSPSKGASHNTLCETCSSIYSLQGKSNNERYMYTG